MMKSFIILTALLATTGITQAALYINAGPAGTATGEGPTGTNANYLAYTSTHESATAGALQTFNNISFAGLGGTYNVGVSFSWPDATADTAKQAFNRANDEGYDVFWQTWVGNDTRTTQGGGGAGSRLVLTLTGLEANTDFVFTSYHFDTSNQNSTFTVNGEPTVYDFDKSDGVDTPGGGVQQSPWNDNAYSFNLTSDGSGNLEITYAQNSGSWVGINGFDLVSAAVPEPSSTALLGLGGLALALRRRR